MGYEISTFSDSISALEHFQKNPDEFDLVITDMTMPKMTGEVLVKKMKTMRPGLPIIICTGFSEIIDEKKAKKLGIGALLYKPVIKKDLLRTIRRILNEHSVELAT